ncbi:hypothetical protein JL100_011770 [Skermanella mucosa]|uniref:hypothetical protein n=1 Tax=Skermanella mucosa TaxID=1789672 RepID=UPI00192B76A9|nr:hypothetical protein [Skermanella mucosa]UEM23373.1 hypothetical protein JL100_011770 [Skermanella mucosa]
MPDPAVYVARLDDGSGTVRVLDPDGRPIEDDDAGCLGDMLGELLDELNRRGFDAASAVFVINRRSDGAP